MDNKRLLPILNQEPPAAPSPLGPEDEEMVNTFNFIKEHEGFRSNRYQDHNKNWTIGHGIREDDEEYQDYIKENPIRSVASGQGPMMTEDQSMDVVSRIMNRKKNELNSMLEGRAAGFKTDDPKKKAVLNNLMYQSRKIFGPSALEALNTNDYNKFAEELLYASNPKKMPGVLNRRLDEAKMFLGEEQFMDLLRNQGPGKVEGLKKLLEKADDPQKRKEILEKHKYLDDILNPKPQIDFYKGLEFLKGKK